jgi:toxin CcdB
MRQFDVALNPDAGKRPAAPYLVILQSHLLYGLPTVIVAPLRRADTVEGITDLQTPVSFDGDDYALMVAEMAHIPTRLLGDSVGSIAAYEDAIRRALDRLFTGF